MGSTFGWSGCGTIKRIGLYFVFLLHESIFTQISPHNREEKRLSCQQSRLRRAFIHGLSEREGEQEREGESPLRAPAEQELGEVGE